MPVTVSPIDEACAALVTRINAAGAPYTLPQAATYCPEVIDILEEVTGLRVDVCHETETQLGETLAVEDRTSHIIRVWVRAKLAGGTPAQLASQAAPFDLINRQIFQRLNNWDSADKRVRVWAAGEDRNEVPGKIVLVEKNLYRAYTEFRVEVEAS